LYTRSRQRIVAPGQKVIFMARSDYRSIDHVQPVSEAIEFWACIGGAGVSLAYHMQSKTLYLPVVNGEFIVWIHNNTSTAITTPTRIGYGNMWLDAHEGRQAPDDSTWEINPEGWLKLHFIAPSIAKRFSVSSIEEFEGDGLALEIYWRKLTTEPTRHGRADVYRGDVTQLRVVSRHQMAEKLALAGIKRDPERISDWSSHRTFESGAWDLKRSRHLRV